MLDHKQFKEFKEIQQKVLKAIKLDNQFQEIKTIGAIDALFSGNNVYTVAATFDYETLELIEFKTLKSKEIIPYSPNMNPIRAGTPMIEVYKMLDKKPDVVLISGKGAINPEKIGEASYFGVITNKPTIGVTKNLIFGRESEDKIFHKEEHKGFIVKSREISNPIYVVPAFGIDKKKSKEIITRCLKNHKLPEPLHTAHKIALRMKKD
jgi:deoxyribonuclease V